MNVPDNGLLAGVQQKAKLLDDTGLVSCPGQFIIIQPAQRYKTAVGQDAFQLAGAVQEIFE